MHTPLKFNDHVVFSWKVLRPSSSHYNYRWNNGDPGSKYEDTRTRKKHENCDGDGQMVSLDINPR